MFTRVVSEGTPFELLDPDASMLRDALPGQGYEPAVTALLRRSLARPGAVFFDIGALYGYFAVWAARATDARVVAFEPGARYADVLQHNLAANGCDDVLVERVALSNCGGSASFAARTLTESDLAAEPARRSYLRGLLNHARRRSRGGEAVRAEPGHWKADPGPWLAATIAERLGLFTRGADQDEQEIRTERLDDWAARTGIQPTTVKIDVHGGEVAVVKGMGRCLGRAEVVIEVHTADLLVSGTHEELVEELEAADLEVFELQGFRGREGRLVSLTGEARRDFCDQGRWTATELYFMRCLYARPRSPSTIAQ